MGVKERRHAALLNLLKSGGQFTAAELAVQLGVSRRSIRDYVREINANAKEPLILSNQHGYQINARCQSATAIRSTGERPLRPAQVDGPEQRLHYLIYQLINRESGIDVFELADELYVSSSTIEADLGRVREILRGHRLTLQRHGDVVQIVGSERLQRRLVRYLLLANRQGLSAGSQLEPGFPQHRAKIRALRTHARAALRDAGLEVNEYALQDILINLVIAIERVLGGHSLKGPPANRPVPAEDDPLWQVTNQILAAVTEIFGKELPESERHELRNILRARSRVITGKQHDDLISPEAAKITKNALRQVSRQFKIDLYDESIFSGIALHVQNLIERARNDDMHATPPLGSQFRRTHPLIHEIALVLAHELELATGIRIAEGEVDFLAFHLGNQVLEQMEQGAAVTVTLVLPQYGDFSKDLEQDITNYLPSYATVIDVITDLSFDWTRIVSDVVITIVDLFPAPPAPVVRISPFLTSEDRRRIAEAVREERRRMKRDVLRTNLITLLDPQLFMHVSAISKADALSLMAETMHEQGYVGPYFLTQVIDREERSSTAFGPAFALPHSMVSDAYRTGISVLVSDTPIEWDNAAVRLVMMFAISQNGRAIFRDVLDELIELLNEPSIVRRIIDNSATQQQFITELLKLITE